MTKSDVGSPSVSVRWPIVAMSVGLLLALVADGGAQPSVIDPRLDRIVRRAAPDGEVRVLVRFSEGVNLNDSELRKAFETRGAHNVVALPIVHSLAATVPVRGIPELAALPGVEHVRMDRPAALPRGASRARPDAQAESSPDARAPLGLSAAETSQTAVRLVWRAPAGGAAVTGYRLYAGVRKSSSAPEWTLINEGITTTSMAVSALTPGGIYQYAVTAVDAAGIESGRSAPLEVRTLQQPRAYHRTQASRPGLFAIVGEPFTYDVDAIGHPAPRFSLAEARAGMSIDADSGVVRWSPGAGDEGVVTVTVRATNHEGADDHTFSFRVEPAGTDRIPPSPVATPIATNVTVTGCTVTWKPATDNVGVAGYLILAQPFGRGERLSIVGETKAPTTTHTLTTLKPGTGHRLWVAAYDAAGNRAGISGVPPAVIKTLPARSK